MTKAGPATRRDLLIDSNESCKAEETILKDGDLISICIPDCEVCPRARVAKRRDDDSRAISKMISETVIPKYIPTNVWRYQDAKLCNMLKYRMSVWTK